MKVSKTRVEWWASYNNGGLSQSMLYYINVLSPKSNYGWNIVNTLSLC